MSLRLPVFAAPMFLISGPDLVIEACRSGVIGCFPTSNCRSAEELREWLAAITGQLGLNEGGSKAEASACAPWAANLVTHSTNSRLPEHLDLICEYKAPIVVTALGSPRPAIEAVHGHGGLVFADVPNLKLARKAAAMGVDGLACICAGAGGHTGHMSPFAFVSAVREFFDGWIVVGGGISDGAGIAGAIAAGADLVYVGTRFLAAKESLASSEYKKMVIESDADGLIVSDAVTGTPGSWLTRSLEDRGVDLAKPVTRNFSGKSRWRDIWSAGQGLHKVKTTESVATIVDDLATEFADAVSRFDRSLRVAATPAGGRLQG